MKRRPLGRRPAAFGQIVIPALFIFPSLMLFIYLIFETAKLSREKIRHQFAVDAAAFVEATNYSDFLNRSAYVNGAFPMRIFREGFHDTVFDCQGQESAPQCKQFGGRIHLDDLLYNNGVFPRDKDEPNRAEYTTETKWNIGYGGTRENLNDPDPTPDDLVTLIDMETAKAWNLNWEDANQVYKLYVQIYQLLGSVESAQFSVLQRLTAQHNFLRKSYWLNTGGDLALAEADSGVASFAKNADVFTSGAVHFKCAGHLRFHGKQLVHSWNQPYQIWASEDSSGNPIALPSTLAECGGLFQLVTVEPRVIQSMVAASDGGFGWPVEVKWTAPGNYFNIDVNNLVNRKDNGPRVHATIAVAGFGASASVWPDPTPKFQTRLYP